jgi:hypothetical protein
VGVDLSLSTAFTDDRTFFTLTSQELGVDKSLN